MGILFIQMGGTIDKSYPRMIKGFAFEIGESVVPSILEEAFVDAKGAEFVSVSQKDSTEIDLNDREALCQKISQSDADRVLVTHGTDTIIETAQFVADRVKNKRIIFTGAFQPYAMKRSDASFNVGFALGCLVSPGDFGVFVSINGALLPASTAGRDPTTNLFQNLY